MVLDLRLLVSRYGADIGLTVDVYAAAFPDMHRELYSLYFSDNVVIVELSLNGTHKGDLNFPASKRATIAACGTQRRFAAMRQDACQVGLSDFRRLHQQRRIGWPAAIKMAQPERH
jgi:hypothetical protein